MVGKTYFENSLHMRTHRVFSQVHCASGVSQKCVGVCTVCTAELNQSKSLQTFKQR